MGGLSEQLKQFRLLSSIQLRDSKLRAQGSGLRGGREQGWAGNIGQNHGSFRYWSLLST